MAMGTKRFVAVAVALVALGGCAKAGSNVGGTSRPTDSGVRGMVVLGPQCPLVMANSPCPDKPYQAEVQVLGAKGDVVATVTSGTDGTFEVALEPGHYLLQGVSPSSDVPFPAPKPVDVTVRPHAFAQATVVFDTGIR